MSTTIQLISFFLGLLILKAGLYAGCLRLGLFWAKVLGVTTKRICFATTTLIAIQLIFSALILYVLASFEEHLVLRSFLQLSAVIIIPWFVINRIFKTSFRQSFQAWLTILIPEVVMGFLVFLFVTPFVFEAFSTTANAMAPTLLGNTWRSECPECGKDNYCSPPIQEHRPKDLTQMICENFHVHSVEEIQPTTFAPDRFLVAKFLTPNRWDIVAFRFPGDPSMLFVMRVVGLPGETIRIEEGAVWADGKKLQPPEHLRGIRYVNEAPNWHGTLWGSKEQPAKLEKDEYFVLGDFSPNSNDSRLWQFGAEGYNPYAVPASHIRGVVTHIHWPPHRCRVLR